MSTLTEPETAEVADLIGKAADVIDTNGHCRRDMYDHRQAVGTPLKDCRVDIIGALNIADHGTPRYTGQSMLIYTAEQAILAHLQSQGDEPAAAIVTWNDAKGRNKTQVAKLLRDVEAGLRAGVAK